MFPLLAAAEEVGAEVDSLLPTEVAEEATAAAHTLATDEEVEGGTSPEGVGGSLLPEEEEDSHREVGAEEEECLPTLTATINERREEEEDWESWSKCESST